jgi:hypothetical protein
MGSTVYVGLAVTSHNDATVNDAAFADVLLTGLAGPGSPPPAYNPLAAPAGLTASPGAGTGLDLAWGPVDGAAGYAVERSPDGVNWAQAAATAAGVTAFADPNLFGSRRYFYRVSALAPDNTRSAPSAVASAVNRPGAPVVFTVTSWTADQLILNWRDASGESGYRVERSPDGVGNWAVVGSVGRNVPSFTDVGLSAATVYHYRVIPTSALGDGPAAQAPAITRLPGLHITGTAPGAIALQWDAAAGATEYRVERALEGGNFTALATVATTAYTDAALEPLREYRYRVVATGPAIPPCYSAATVFGASPAVAQPLPTGWSARDVGGVGGPGAAGYTNRRFTVLGSGADIWNTADGFHFVYRTLAGDGEIIARLASQEATDVWAKAGVMIRESLAAGSKYAMMAVTPGNGAAFQRRTATNGQSFHNGLGGPTAPHWVKLVRQGNTLTGYASADGVTWTPVGSSAVTMGATVFVGLSVTAHNNGTLSTAAFTDVSVNGVPV